MEGARDFNILLTLYLPHGLSEWLSSGCCTMYVSTPRRPRVYKHVFYLLVAIWDKAFAAAWLQRNETFHLCIIQENPQQSGVFIFWNFLKKKGGNSKIVFTWFFIEYLTRNVIFHVKGYVTKHVFWGLFILKSQNPM